MNSFSYTKIFFVLLIPVDLHNKLHLGKIRNCSSGLHDLTYKQPHPTLEDDTRNFSISVWPISPPLLPPPPPNPIPLIINRHLPTHEPDNEKVAGNINSTCEEKIQIKVST